MDGCGEMLKTVEVPMWFALTDTPENLYRQALGIKILRWVSEFHIAGYFFPNLKSKGVVEIWVLINLLVSIALIFLISNYHLISFFFVSI